MDFGKEYKVILIASENKKFGINFSKFHIELENVEGLNVNDKITFDPRDGQYLKILAINSNILTVVIITTNKDEYFINNRDVFYKIRDNNMYIDSLEIKNNGKV